MKEHTAFLRGHNTAAMPHDWPMNRDAKKKKWTHPRHRIVRNIAAFLLRPYTRLVYGIRVEPFREQGKRPYLILFNHQTAFDQFFVGLAFSGAVYYVASEDLFSNGWLSSLIRFLVAPIPIKKQTVDVRAVMDCLRVAREGGTIAMAPEGNRTYSGRTGYINPAVAPLARKLRMPIALFRIEGGYGVHPRWSDVIRKGKMRGYVSRVIEPETYAAMTDEQLCAEIRRELYVDEAVCDGAYNSKKSAEYLERALYVCPVCGLSSFESKRDTLTCLTCGRTVRYRADKTLEGVGFSLPYRFVADWYDAQSDYINHLDLSCFTDTPMYRETASLYEVIPYQKKKRLCRDAEVSLWGDRMEIRCGENVRVFPFARLSGVTVLGRNKLNLYHDGHILQLRSGKRFNALKYVQIYHRYKNLAKGDEHEQFLGL